jgi:hypothetical protein
VIFTRSGHALGRVFLCLRFAPAPSSPRPRSYAAPQAHEMRVVDPIGSADQINVSEAGINNNMIVGSL